MAAAIKKQTKYVSDFFLITLSQLYLKQIPVAPNYQHLSCLGWAMAPNLVYQDKILKCIRYLFTSNIQISLTFD